MIMLTESGYGFWYGPVEVLRTASDEKRGWVLLSINSKKGMVQVYVTKTGKMRIFKVSGKIKLE